MKQYDVRQCRVTDFTQLTADIYSAWVDAGELARMARPGQFAQIYVPGKTLRRPISICDAEGDKLRFVFQIRGEVTAILSQTRVGDSWDILAPLGHGFELRDTARKACFVGGGIGVPPLLAAAKSFGANAVVVTGFRSKSAVILQDDFTKNGNRVILATDDGSAGHHGLVTECLPDGCEVLFACGPTPMLRALTSEAEKRGIECQISLEQRMACGIGACLGCAVKLKTEDGGWRHGHVCKDGPVFDARIVAFD